MSIGGVGDPNEITNLDGVALSFCCQFFAGRNGFDDFGVFVSAGTAGPGETAAACTAAAAPAAVAFEIADAVVLRPSTSSILASRECWGCDKSSKMLCFVCRVVKYMYVYTYTHIQI